MDKLNKRLYFIIGIVGALTSLFYFIIPFPRKSVDVYWITYIFFVLVVLSQVVVVYKYGDNFKKKENRFISLSLIQTDLICVISSAVVVILVTLINCFVAVPLWILITILLIATGICLINFLVKDSAVEYVISNNKSINEKSVFINNLKLDIASFNDKIVDGNFKQSLMKLKDIIEYSDPISHNEVENIEEEINKKYILMKNHYNNNEFVESCDLIDELIVLIKERNKVLKSCK